jgi:hypothetical protein
MDLEFVPEMCSLEIRSFPRVFLGNEPLDSDRGVEEGGPEWISQ